MVKLEPIYDRYGQVVAWFEGETGDIFDTRGTALGFVDGDGYFNYVGEFLGQFDSGVFWDLLGLAICFLEGATGGPLLPVTAVPPIEPIHSTPPPRPLVPFTPFAPMQSILVWSDADFVQIFRK
jgi:hypothetical protein